jgi:2-(1,2-epoxy-1,2-dihydrophenyl)acetyl-CoA isomerase
MDAPVVAAVNGTAAGAGVGLVAMADLALCARSSKFTLAYTNAGLTPDAGTTFLLPRTLGVKRAMELLLLNRTLAAQAALDWGLVNEVVADEQLLGRAVEIAEQLAQGACSAYGATKRLLAHSLGALEAQMVLESETIAAHAVGREGTEGVSAFLEKRKPQFPDRGGR